MKIFGLKFDDNRDRIDKQIVSQIRYGVDYAGKRSYNKLVLSYSHMKKPIIYKLPFTDWSDIADLRNAWYDNKDIHKRNKRKQEERERGKNHDT